MLDGNESLTSSVYPVRNTMHEWKSVTYSGTVRLLESPSRVASATVSDELLYL